MTKKTIDEQAEIGQNQTLPKKNEKVDIHSINLEKTPMTKKQKKMAITLSIFAVVAGITTGFGGFKLGSKTSVLTSNQEPDSKIEQVPTKEVKAGDVFGVQDEETFKDSAEGYLEEGGINGEGSHKLLRAGGESQTVYLTSSVTDLNEFIGMDIKIWGETFKAQKAGWLMDIGRIEVIDPKGSSPTEE